MKTRWQKIFIRKDCDLPTFEGVIVTAYKEIFKIKNRRREYLFGRFKDKHFHYYSHGINRWDIGRHLYQRDFNTPAQIIKAYRDGQRFLKKTLKKTAAWKKRLAQNPDKHLLRQSLKDFHRDFVFVNFHYSISPWWALESWQHDFEEIVGNLIKNRRIEGKYEKIMTSLLQPWKETAIRVAGQKLAKNTSLAKLVEQFQFLRSWTVVWYKPITASWIRSTAQNPLDEDLYSQKHLFRLLKPNKIESRYLKMAPYIIFFKDWRDDLRRKHAFDWGFLFDAIAKHLKTERKNLGYFSLEELSEMIIRGKLDQKLLSQRNGKEFIVTWDYELLSLKIYPGIPLKYRRAIAEAENIKQLASVTGIVAQGGLVKGRVHLVKNHHDIKKIEKGEILVSNTTHPDYLQGMKKAAAFVTDEGGIASHAAIVAREFKKPCVVGTKLATKVFKDGDWVEVDANKGLVRKIS